MTFEEKLQMLRKKKGFSQEQLAEQLNVSRQAVSKWETGESLPDTEKVILLASVFNVTIDYLLNPQIAEENEQDKIKNLFNNEASNNYYIAKISKLIKQKGYIAGYLISIYGILALGIMRFAHFSFKSILMPPEGWGITMADLPTSMKIPLYFTNILSAFALLIIIFGVGLAFYLKKKK